VKGGKPTTKETPMKKLLILALAVAALALAACGGDDDEDGDQAAASDTTPAATQNDGATTVAVEELGDAGSVLVDSSGRALYTSDLEADGNVLCTKGCESAWMPLSSDGGQPAGSVPGELGTVERPDGTSQVTYDGVPVYTFTEEGPGEVTGDGFADEFDGQRFTWSVVAVDGGSDSSEASDDTGGGGIGY
jgi:predicted lipoprotein with Yx(FWY)xxD motif